MMAKGSKAAVSRVHTANTPKELDWDSSNRG